MNRKAIKLVEQIKDELRAVKFDGLEVIRAITTLYMKLDNMNREYFKELYISRYAQVYFRKRKRYPEDTIYEMAEMYLIELLAYPNETTKYIYETETLRKRDRAIENINATKNNADKEKEIDKALRYWAMQTGYYADIVCEDANIQALKDNDVKQVMWFSENDFKVCAVCEDLDGEIFTINNIPPPPHPHCRCHVEEI